MVCMALSICPGIWIVNVNPFRFAGTNVTNSLITGREICEVVEGISYLDARARPPFFGRCL
jgi:hypothetical protein